MHGVKSKVGPLCLCCVVVWLVLVYGENWGQLAQSATVPLFFLPGQRNTDSFSWICPVFNSSISRRSWNLFLCPCKWALRLKARWLNTWTWTTKRRKGRQRGGGRRACKHASHYYMHGPVSGQGGLKSQKFSKAANPKKSRLIQNQWTAMIHFIQKWM